MAPVAALPGSASPSTSSAFLPPSSIEQSINRSPACAAAGEHQVVGLFDIRRTQFGPRAGDDLYQAERHSGFFQEPTAHSSENGVRLPPLGFQVFPGGVRVVARGQRDVDDLLEGVPAGFAVFRLDDVEHLVLAFSHQVVRTHQHRGPFRDRPCRPVLLRLPCAGGNIAGAAVPHSAERRAGHRVSDFAVLSRLGSVHPRRQTVEPGEAAGSSAQDPPRTPLQNIVSWSRHVGAGPQIPCGAKQSRVRTPRIPGRVIQESHRPSIRIPFRPNVFPNCSEYEQPQWSLCRRRRRQR